MFTVPLATPPLHQHRWAVVINDLPLLSGTAVAAAGNAIATSLNSMVVDNRQNRIDDEARHVAESAKTPDKFFGPIGLAKLLRLSQVATSAELPQFWHDLAAAPKKNNIMTIQQAFNATALALNMPGTEVPITPDIATKIINLSFEMSDESDLTTGLHQFTFGYMNPEEIAAAYDLQEQYNMLQQGQGAPTLAETIALTRATQTRLARMLTEATISYGKWRVVLHTLFGPTHQLTRNWDVFWTNWNAGLTFLLNIRTRTPGLFPALTMRWNQLRTSLWFHQQGIQNGTVQVPNFGSLLTKIRLQEVWEPYIPTRYLTAPQPDAPHLPTLNLPLAQPSPAPPALAPPATPSLPTGPGPTTGAQGRGTLECKTSPLNPVFQPFINLALRVRDVLCRAGPANRVPNNAGGTEMCLSYHIKGMCNTSCAHRADHRDHTPDEDNALLQWCQQHYTPE